MSNYSKIIVTVILLHVFYFFEVNSQRYPSAKREIDEYLEREKAKKNETVDLRCYQCISDHRDPAPLCDTRYWKLTTLEDRKTMSIDCSAGRSAFCAKKIEKVGDGYRTFRGCVGPLDINGRQIRLGCITTKAEIDTLICTCKTDYCNSCNRISYFQGFTIFLILKAFII